MRRRLAISRTEILIFLLMFPIIKPGSLRVVVPVLESLFDVGRMISILAISLIVLFSHKSVSKIKSSFWILIILELWIIFVTALNNPNRFLVSVINGGAILAVSMIVVHFAKSSPKALLRALMANFEWVIYVNLITQIFIPDGLYDFRGNPCYFLGLNNSAIIYILPAVTIAYLYFLCFGKKLRPFLLITISVISIILGWCATSVVGLIVAGVMLLLINGKKIRDGVKLLYVWIASVIIDLLITVVRIMDTFPPLRNFIVNFLGKSTTLSGRIHIWEEALLYWRRAPVFGHGYYTTLPYGITYVSHAHNAYIQYLLISGLTGLIFFVLYHLSVIRNFDLSCGLSRSGKAIKVAGAVLFITYITEACNYPLLFIIYTLAECIPIFVSLEDEQNRNGRKIVVRI